MHNPVAHCNQAVVFAMSTQEFNQVRDSPVVTQPRALLPLARANVRASRIFGGKDRGGVKAFNLATQQQIWLRIAISEQRKFDARRAGI